MSNEQKKKSPFSSKKFRHGTFAVLLIDPCNGLVQPFDLSGVCLILLERFAMLSHDLVDGLIRQF